MFRRMLDFARYLLDVALLVLVIAPIDYLLRGNPDQTQQTQTKPEPMETPTPNVIPWRAGRRKP